MSEDPVNFETFLRMAHEHAPGEPLSVIIEPGEVRGAKLTFAVGDEKAEYYVVEDIVGQENDFSHGLKDPSDAMSRRDVYRMIDGEREYQEELWNTSETSSRKSVGEYLTLIRAYSYHADNAYTKGDEEGAREDIRKLAALAVHCLEIHGALPRVNNPVEAKPSAQVVTWEFDPNYVPTVEEVGDALKALHEDHGAGVAFLTHQIAKWLACDPDVLFNADTEEGPLYKMFSEGLVGCDSKFTCWGLRGAMQWEMDTH